MRWLAIWLTAAVVLWSTAIADEVAPPSLHEPLPFDHAEHSKTFDRGGVTCVDCHPIGSNATDIPPPLSACHACHLREVKGAPKGAERACATCHSERSELLPTGHAIGWITGHGWEARARKSTCDDCHDSDQCVDCHDARGAMSRNPHGPGFASTHGVEAKLDPYSCTTCHTGDRCASCHSKGATPW